MNSLRYYARGFAAATMFAGVISLAAAMLSGKSVPMIVWTFIGMSIGTILCLFRGWSQIAAWFGNAIAPRVNAGANAAAGAVYRNRLLTLTMFLGGLTLVSIGVWFNTDEIVWLRYAVLSAFLTLASAITCNDGWGSVKRNSVGWWLGLSLAGLTLVPLFGGGWLVAFFFAVSAVLATSVLIRGWVAVIQAIGDAIWWIIRMTGRAIVWVAGGFARLLTDLLLGNKYGKDAGYFTAFVIAFAVALYFTFNAAGETVDLGGWKIGVAFLCWTATVGLFIASAGLFVKTRLVR